MDDLKEMKYHLHRDMQEDNFFNILLHNYNDHIEGTVIDTHHKHFPIVETKKDLITQVHN